MSSISVLQYSGKASAIVQLRYVPYSCITEARGPRLPLSTVEDLSLYVVVRRWMKGGQDMVLVLVVGPSRRDAVQECPED